MKQQQQNNKEDKTKKMKQQQQNNEEDETKKG